MKPGEGGDELDDVWLLDLRLPSADLVWSCVSPPNRAPPNSLQRCHGAASLGHTILFFGGGRSTNLTNALALFDTDSGTWRDGPTRLTGRPPSTRQNAQCAVIPGTGTLVVFGGWKLGAYGQDQNLGDTILLDLDHEAKDGGEAEVRPSVWLSVCQPRRLFVSLALAMAVAAFAAFAAAAATLSAPAAAADHHPD